MRGAQRPVSALPSQARKGGAWMAVLRVRKDPRVGRQRRTMANGNRKARQGSSSEYSQKGWRGASHRACCGNYDGQARKDLRNYDTHSRGLGSLPGIQINRPPPLSASQRDTSQSSQTSLPFGRHLSSWQGWGDGYPASFRRYSAHQQVYLAYTTPQASAEPSGPRSGGHPSERVTVLSNLWSRAERKSEWHGDTTRRAHMQSLLPSMEGRGTTAPAAAPPPCVCVCVL